MRPHTIQEIANELNVTHQQTKTLLIKAETNFREQFKARMEINGVAPEAYLEQVFDCVFAKGSSLSRCEEE
jgi:hypothetical protein